MPKLTTTITILFLLTLFESCRTVERRAETKIIDFGQFTIEVPQEWQKVSRQGIDSHVGSIAIDQTDTISFDLGPYSYTLPQRELIPVTKAELQEDTHLDLSEIIIIEDIRSHKDFDQFKMESLVWETIGNREAKVVFPRKPGHGHTGIYIDSLRGTGAGRQKFNFFGTDLKLENQSAAIKAFRTLKFKDSR